MFRMLLNPSVIRLNAVKRWYHAHHLRVSKMYPSFRLIEESSQKSPIKETADKRCISRKLMVQHSLIKSASAGTYYMFPLLTRVLQKLYRVIDDTMQSIGAHRITTPCLAPGTIWKQSGRWDEMGAELLKLQDRHHTSHCLAPTHEEAVTSMISGVRSISHRQLPLKYYQIGRKFRDEMRAKNGLIRCREFEMKDLYTFDVTLKDAERTYEEVCEAYCNMFERLGLPYEKVPADCGAMGGSKSHEYLLESPIGEARFLRCALCGQNFNVENKDSQLLLNNCLNENCPKETIEKDGIEVAHAFLLGSKYSEIFNTKVTDSNNNNSLIQMGCFGIGVTRLLAAAVEILSTTAGIRWPKLLAPHQITIISQQKGYYFEESKAMAEDLQVELLSLPNLHNEVVLDDRYNMSLGKRILASKENGIPYLLVLGKAVQQDPPMFEVIDVYNNSTENFARSQLIDKCSQLCTIIV